MKWAYQIKHKLKAVCFLAGIMAVMIAGNFLYRSSFTDLDTAMSSVVADRLKPASYLFSISSNLYQKKALLGERELYTEAELNKMLAEHNTTIASLTQQYEATTLTKEEKKQWMAFKTNLAAYNVLESANANGHQMDTYLASCMTNLDALNRIQVGEGSNLQKSSSNIVSNTLMLSSLETTLLIILGLCTLVILSTTERVTFNPNQNQALN